MSTEVDHSKRIGMFDERETDLVFHKETGVDRFYILIDYGIDYITYEFDHFKIMNGQCMLRRKNDKSGSSLFVPMDDEFRQFIVQLCGHHDGLTYYDTKHKQL